MKYFTIPLIRKQWIELEKRIFSRAWYCSPSIKYLFLNNIRCGDASRQERGWFVISRNPQEALGKVAALRVYTPHFRVDTDLRRTPREVSVSSNPHTYTRAKAGSNIHGMKMQSDKVPPIKLFDGKTATWTEYSPPTHPNLDIQPI